MQRLEVRDHHAEQLNNDARGDVRHDAERKDGQLQQRAAREQVDQAKNVIVLGDSHTLLHVRVVDPGGRNVGTDTEDRNDPHGEQQLAPQVRRAERLSECA